MRDIAAEVSKRITLLRFPLIVGVVFIHAYGAEENLSGETIRAASVSKIVYFVQDLFSQVLPRVAVPLFYAISGYLFFAKFDGSKKSYSTRLQSRVNTLLIPYLIWNTLTIICFALAQAFPLTNYFLSGQNKLVAEFGLLDYFNAFFGYGPKRQPIAYQLWYIRDLILLVILAPAIAVLVRNWPKLFLACSAATWLYVGRRHSLPIDPGAWLFFCLGAVVAGNVGRLAIIDRIGLPVTCIYLAVAFLDAALPRTHLVGMLTHKAGICIGIISAWYLIGKISIESRAARALIRLAPYAFFVFASHALLLTALRKLAYKLIVPESGLVILLIYFLAPAITIAITLGTGFGLHRYAPRAFRVLSGGRNPKTGTREPHRR
jgi:surface polysaccharide O-acyltransferase-like enzyme